MKVFKNLRNIQFAKLHNIRYFCKYNKFNEDEYFTNMSKRIDSDHLQEAISKNLEHTSNTIDYEINEYQDMINNLDDLGWKIIYENKIYNNTIIEKRFQTDSSEDHQIKIVVWPQELGDVFTDVYKKNTERLQNKNLIKKNKIITNTDQYHQQFELDKLKIIEDTIPADEKEAGSMSEKTEMLVQQKLAKLMKKREKVLVTDDLVENSSLDYQHTDSYEEEKYSLNHYIKKTHSEGNISNVYMFQIIIENLSQKKASKKSQNNAICYACDMGASMIADSFAINGIYKLNNIENYLQECYFNFDGFQGRIDSSHENKYVDLKIAFYRQLFSFGIDESFIEEYVPELSLYTEAKMSKINSERAYFSINQKTPQLSQCLENNT